MCNIIIVTENREMKPSSISRTVPSMQNTNKPFTTITDT